MVKSENIIYICMYINMSRIC